MMPPTQNDGRMGGQYGYNNYNNRSTADQGMMGGYGQQQQQGYGNYGNYRMNQPEQLDIAIQEQRISKNQRPPSNPKQ